MAYKTAIQEWENGKKLPWERRLSPSEVVDLGSAMKIFATEGCAACHRLKGYSSDVGFAVEKEGKATFEEAYAEREWFRKLFPENVLGSQIAAAAEAHADEIDRKIIRNPNKKSILNEIQESFPETIESFYSNFRFASRVKKDLAWKERLEKFLMVYIQEYGLGRLIGPRPNWSGVYRSVKWLMEHFKNPQAMVPRSLMPVFPLLTKRSFMLSQICWMF